MNESGLVYVGEKTGSSRAVYDHVVNEYPCLVVADDSQRTERPVMGLPTYIYIPERAHQCAGTRSENPTSGFGGMTMTMTMTMTMRLGRPGQIGVQRRFPWLFERRGRSEEGTTPDETGGRLLLFGSMKRATGLIKGLMKLYHRVRGTKED
jgi:hypothetical protein